MLVSSFCACLQNVTGVCFKVHTSDWFWDGKVEAEKIFAMHLPGVTGHVCLQHARKCIQARCTGGFKQAVPMMIDCMTFMPPPVFHICMSIFLDELTVAGQHACVKMLKGEMRGKSQFSLTKTDAGDHSAKWKSSHVEVYPFCTAYASNTVEAAHRVDHIAHGKTKRKMLAYLFQSCQEQFNMWEHTKQHENIEHELCGMFQHQPCLIRGPGLWEAKTCLHAKGFFRPTVASFSKSVEEGADIVVKCGQARGFMETCGFVKQCPDHFDEPAMKQFHKIMFAKDAEACKEHLPTFHFSFVSIFGCVQEDDEQIHNHWEIFRAPGWTSG